MMKKRMLSLLLTAALLTAALPAALGSALPDEAEAVQVLSALDIMAGDPDGDLRLGEPINRAEFVKMAVAATPAGSGVGAASTSPYPDVPRTHWAAGYVQAGVEAGLVHGDLRGNFRPSDPILLCDGVKVVLALLGYQSSDFSGAYPSGQMAKYRDLHLDKGVAAGQNSPLTRRDCLYLFYNLLTAPTKTTGQPYLLTLGHSLTPSGEIDLVALVNSAMEGPVVVCSGWESKLGFSPSSARTVYRGGDLSSYSSLQPNDLVYWSKSMRTLWAYTTQATGTITAITPAAAPTSVTVAGRTYGIETSSAAYALSDLGPYSTGDTVTLLLGRSGGVAAVLSSAQTSSVVYGLVESVASGSYTDANGNPYTANTVTLRATDGSQRSYRCDDRYIAKGNLVQVSTAGGNVTVKRLTSSTLSGKFNTDGTRLGNRSLASDVEILDTYSNTALRIYPSRLAGVALDERKVAYYHLNTAGEIDRLILKDATGDLHRYGVVLSSAEYSGSDPLTGGITVSSQYQFDIGGQLLPGGSGNKSFNVSAGPAKFVFEDGEVKSVTNLTSIKVDGVDGRQAVTGNRTWPLADAVAVYEVRENKYYFSSLSIVEGGGYSLTGWYDNQPAAGGCIRVLIARPN